MKMNDIKLIEENGKVFIAEINKRGCYRQKKEVTTEFLKFAVKNLSSAVITSEDKQYLTAIREMDREQKEVFKLSKKQKNEKATENWDYITGALMGSLFSKICSNLKHMYRI